MNDSHYNTTHETGETLERFERQASRQEDVILRWFRRHPGRLYTPSQINGLLPGAPITSIRRALTNLTKAGHLVKTGHKRSGDYGRPEHCWVYPVDAGQRAVGGDLTL